MFFFASIHKVILSRSDLEVLIFLGHIDGLQIFYFLVKLNRNHRWLRDCL